MPERQVIEWFGVLAARSAYNQDLVAARDRLADSARAGDWPAVLRILDSDSGWAGANDWRISGTSWFGPLHQAAWLGAPEEVAWRQGFLSDDELRTRGEQLLKSGYGAYLLDLLERGR